MYNVGNKSIIKHGLLYFVIAVCVLVSACSASSSKAGKPETHTITANPKMGTLNDEDGADAFNNELDHADSRYFVLNDYYNMKSSGSLHILSHFETYQQTTEYTCGCAAALMALNYYGIKTYDEMQICKLTKTDTRKGTSVEGLVSFFKSIGLSLDYHASTDDRFDRIEKAEDYLLAMIDKGYPVLVDWVDWYGHWQTIIGIDTCGTDSPYDDVLIMADSYDVTDHFQDGYYVVPFGRFFDMWREGPCAAKDVPYEQPFIVAMKPE